MNQTAILTTTYFGPIQFYQKLFSYTNCIIEQHEHFIKQTYRSRCDIYSPNGLLTLSIPLVKRNKRQSIKDVKIFYEYNWQLLHWRSIESSYRRSPFFEYYEDDLRYLFFEKKYDFLIDLNEEVQNKLLELLQKKANTSYSSEYISNYENASDFRNTINPKIVLSEDAAFQIKPYHQVFETRHGFIANLSVLDVLFNQGSRALDYI